MTGIKLIISFLWLPAVVAAIGYYLIWNIFPRGIKITFKRELGSYFYSPIAYVCVFVFVILASILAFYIGGFIERGDASLTDSFFTFHPWIFIFVAPAIGMRLWSEEHRQGTIELLETMPIATWHVIVGKFLAALCVIWFGLFCTFPAVITMEVLGDPDWGPMKTGYMASFFLAATCLGITSAVSAFTRSQVVAFLIAVLACGLMMFLGIPPVAEGIGSFFATILFLDENTVAGWFTNLGFWNHFREMNKGIVTTKDLIYFISIISFCLFTTAVVLRARRA